MNYYERHIGDYLKDTAHLSLLEHGIYTRLLDVYYTRESSLPEDQVARLVGARSDDEKAALLIVLREFFVLEDGFWGQPRCEREIERYQDKQRKAKASAETRWMNTDRNADVMRSHSEGNAPSLQTPVTSKQPSVVRGRKRCPDDFEVTETMRSAMAAECPGVNLEAETRGFRDWEFKTARTDWPAAWRTWMRKAFKDTRPHSETAYQRSMRERAAEMHPAIARKAPGQITPNPMDVLDAITQPRITR